MYDLQMLTEIFFNTLSVCCFILIIIVLHSEVADLTFHGFLDAYIFFFKFCYKILCRKIIICIRNSLNIGGIWCWTFSLGY